MENFDLPPTPLPSPTPSFPTPPPKHTKKTFTDKTHITWGFSICTDLLTGEGE